MVCCVSRGVDSCQGGALYLEHLLIFNRDELDTWETIDNSTVKDCYSEDRFSGNDGFSGTKTPDDAILFTVSGITVLVELFLENFGTFCQFSYIFLC